MSVPLRQSDVPEETHAASERHYAPSEVAAPLRPSGDSFRTSKVF